MFLIKSGIDIVALQVFFVKQKTAYEIRLSLVGSGVVVVYDSLKNRGVQGEKRHEQHSKAQKADG